MGNRKINANSSNCGAARYRSVAQTVDYPPGSERPSKRRGFDQTGARACAPGWSYIKQTTI